MFWCRISELAFLPSRHRGMLPATLAFCLLLPVRAAAGSTPPMGPQASAGLIRERVHRGLRQLVEASHVPPAYPHVIIVEPPRARRNAGRHWPTALLPGLGHEDPAGDAPSVLGWLAHHMPRYAGSALARLATGKTLVQLHTLTEGRPPREVPRGGTLYSLIRHDAERPFGVGFADLLADHGAGLGLPRVESVGLDKPLFVVGRRIWVTSPELEGAFATLGWDSWVYETGENVQHLWLCADPVTFPPTQPKN